MPETYAVHDTLAVLVVLDGDEYSGIAANTVKLYRFGEKIPPTVVVSLPSTPESRWRDYTPTATEASENDSGNATLYQYTGGFEAFATSIETTLFPAIEAEYNITLGRKTVFGHSMGGLAVLSFMVVQPDIFDQYIAASPSTMYDDHFIFRTIEEQRIPSFDALYLTAALNDSNGYLENVRWLEEYLKTNHKAGENVGVRVYETESHATSGIRALVDGIEFMGGL